MKIFLRQFTCEAKDLASILTHLMYNLKNMTEEQKIQWRRKIGQGNKGKKRTDEDRKKMSEWVKSHPYRRMHHQITKKIANVPIEKVQ